MRHDPRGDLDAAGPARPCLAYNPASPLLVAAALVVLVRAGIGWRTGRWLTVILGGSWLLRVVAVVAVLALWANQQQHAALLSAR